MALAGDLRDLHLFEILQLVSLGRSTGSLSVRHGVALGRISFHLGEIVHAAIESDPGSEAQDDEAKSSLLRLGALLVQQGLMSEAQRQQALRHQLETKPWRPYGAICLELGFLSEEQLEDNIIRLITERIDRIANWSEGQFRFEPGNVTTTDSIAIDTRRLFSLWCQSAGYYSVSEFFPERRAAAAGEKATDTSGEPQAPNLEQEPDVDSHEFAAMAQLPDIHQLVSDIIDSHPFREQEESNTMLTVYRESARIGETLLSTNEHRSQGEVALLLLQFAEKYLQRVVLLYVEDENLTSLGHFGLPLECQPILNQLRHQPVASQGSQFSSLINSGHTYEGPLNDATWRLMRPILGGQRPEQSILIPIIVASEVKLFLYGDNGAEGLTDGIHRLKMFMNQVGMVFEIALLRSRRTRKQAKRL